MVIRERSRLESLGLVVFGLVGIAFGGSTLIPPAIVARAAPNIAPPIGGWPRMPEHAEKVVSYTLNAKLDPVAHVVEGSGTMALVNVATVPISSVRLHLYLNAFKHDRTVFRRARVGGFRGDERGAPGFIDVKELKLGAEDLWAKRTFVKNQGKFPQDPLMETDPPPIEGMPDDETDVLIPLPKPVEPGASLTLSVAWTAQLPEVSERTGYMGSFHFAGQWFPKFAKLESDGRWAGFPFHHLGEFYADFGNYDVTIQAPSAFTIGASGVRQSETDQAGLRTVRYTLEDVHDFAFTAWDRFIEKTAQEGSVAIRALGPKGYDWPLEREIESARHGLRDYGARFGAYPYPVLTIVHPPAEADEAGGMEYPTLITTGGSWMPRHGSAEVEAVTIHELGHQWFYGLIATHEVAWPAGDEGFNSWGEGLALDSLLGTRSAIRLGSLDVSMWAFNRRGADTAYDEPIFQPVTHFADGRSYGARVYGATATLLETLRRTYGPSVETAMGVYTRMNRFKHPIPQDFFATLERVVTKDGKECAGAAIMATSRPGRLDFSVEGLSGEPKHVPAGYIDRAGGRVKDDGKERAGFSNVVWIARRGDVSLPVDVELRFEDQSRRRAVVRFVQQPDQEPLFPGTESWRRIDVDGPSRLVGVVIDPDEKMLFDSNPENNFSTVSGHSGSMSLTSERATAWLSTLASWVGP